MSMPLLDALKEDKWVKPYLKQYKFSLALALFLGFATFFAAAALMFNSGFLISKSATRPYNILLVYIPIVLTRAFGIARPVFRYMERLTSHNWVLRMTSKLRVRLYKSVEQDAIFLKRNFRLGDVMGLLSEDINHLQNLYLRTIFPTFIAWLLYVFLVVALGFFSIWFSLFMAFYLLILLLVFPLWSVLVNGARQKKEKLLKEALYTDLTDNVMGIADWIFSQRSQEYVQLHEASQTQLAATQAAMRRFNHLRNLLFELLYGGLVLVTLFWTSSRFGGGSGQEANWIAAFVLSLFPLVDAFAGLSAAAQESNSYADSIERLNALPEVNVSEKVVPVVTPPFDIAIEDLTFRYQLDSKKVLDHLSLTIKEGQKLAILGRSGSGKSTLAHLLRGDLLPCQGPIRLAGIPVQELGDKVADYMGVIQQSPNTSLGNNLRLGNEAASDEALWEVLERVGLKAMVEALPNGLETMVDEAGLRFSGGERHRLALARILLQDTPIVLLDEPTVGLDPITEQHLLTTFMEVLKDKTLIWITHHLKGIEYADQVIFIEDGKLEMSGSPEDLYYNNSRYRQLKLIDDGEDID
ncbi:thiol reductant ABC exporter subunit CydC [Streptococcus ictaluri]|uniref:Thiol reductant ABC exporter, CydC subunit n=1 Tax=Streptococcus ictaluri 707-05 TaxID=764299 RepID=G5K4J5_9STRE|nr:thiol reductant ABC exporter subunit CydC [Streptococcus ictaluri]EHI68924.1 thiol reductant ABC exporter, CydC subunit [Streptococcus ictaluri 707-05]